MLAQRPPMGWNSWNTFGKDIHEDLIKEMADAMVDLGYLDAGYTYLVIDDCWAEKQRDENGKLVPDKEKFPSGMKALSDYVHSKGLKFGMYSCAGLRTCADYPSSYGHEFVDAKTFAEWGVDFLKYDFCYFPQSGNCKQAYQTMSLALKHSGREILFSACNWGVEDPWNWMRSIGVHMYRSTGDIQDKFESFKKIGLSQVDNLCCSAPGCYNDPDMLIVGMYGKGNVGLGGCTDEEYRTHFAMWCLFGVPLMMGGDIRNVNEFSRSLMQNKELIAINQDEEARPPYRVYNQGYPNDWDTYTFIKHLSNGEYVLAYFNMGDEDRKLSLPFVGVGLPYYSGCGFHLTDIFSGEDMGAHYDIYSAQVPAHGCRLFRAKVVDL